ncbi:phage GP46 family protein [Desulfobulbus elongatus]|uniref:phage GP46 family protein n=1 Tax=Desulfobulbus elongatus TaxID=53332 RepID=UPI0004876465|nr:phage GP46 family protein [Desulfobulbus elongatus]
MDYAITIAQGSLAGAMTWDECGDLANNVYLSLAVEKGSWFHNPDFGLRRRERMKNTEQNAALIRHDYLEALQWLLDTGKAKEVRVNVRRDRAIDLGRLLIDVEVRQTNDRAVAFTFFQEVA